MAVIKSLDRMEGHLWNGKHQEPRTNVGALIEVIKDRRDRERDLSQVSYIGQEGALDVDPDKIKCPTCRENLRMLR